jgi:hypothetical protein
VPLVCSGSRLKGHWPAIEEQQRALGLLGQVRFLGGVPADDVRALYALAQFTVFPSLFEGGALPLLESWLEGTPVTCARSTMLPELAGAAALLFDPNSPAAIAEAIAAMAKDPALRADLSRAGRERVREFTWERTAKTYRAVYRQAARRTLSEEDRFLLQGASGESDCGRSTTPAARADNPRLPRVRDSLTRPGPAREDLDSGVRADEGSRSGIDPHLPPDRYF